MSGNVKIFDKRSGTVKDFWKDFEEFIFKNKNLIWRGHASSNWKLHSSLYRDFLAKETKFSLKEVKKFIKNFEIYLARGGIFPFKEKNLFIVG